MVDLKFWKLYDFRISLYSTVFEVADYEFDIGIQNCAAALCCCVGVTYGAAILLLEDKARCVNFEIDYFSR